MNRLVAIVVALAATPAALAQEPQDRVTPDASAVTPAGDAPVVDTSAIEGKIEATEAALAAVRTEVDRSKRLKISGYVQGRWASREDAFYRADATANSGAGRVDTIGQTGFHIRRGRVKAVYDADWSQFVVQLDAIPTGISLKEGFASIKLPLGMAVDAGLQLFPFGYEVGTRSSSDLDTLERAQISRRFLAGEYDLGVALKGKYDLLSWKVGLFNGNGVDSRLGVDNDQLKDVIGRVTADLGLVTLGASGWWGEGINYQQLDANGDPRRFDRQRIGADAQLFLDLLPIGGTALKGEYVWGKSWVSDRNFGAGDRLDVVSSGWYAGVTQNAGPWNQLAVRYESFRRQHGIARVEASDVVWEEAELQAAVHTFVGDGGKLSVAWFHPLNGAAGDLAPEPERDRYIVQFQAKF